MSKETNQKKELEKKGNIEELKNQETKARTMLHEGNKLVKEEFEFTLIGMAFKCVTESDTDMDHRSQCLRVGEFYREEAKKTGQDVLLVGINPMITAMESTDGKVTSELYFDVKIDTKKYENKEAKRDEEV